MTSPERSAELASALRFVQRQALINAVAVCNHRDLPSLRAYLALCEREHGGKQNAYSVACLVKARRLLAEALEVAELERMVGL